MTWDRVIPIIQSTIRFALNIHKLRLVILLLYLLTVSLLLLPFPFRLVLIVNSILRPNLSLLSPTIPTLLIILWKMLFIPDFLNLIVVITIVFIWMLSAVAKVFVWIVIVFISVVMVLISVEFYGLILSWVIMPMVLIFFIIIIILICPLVIICIVFSSISLFIIVVIVLVSILIILVIIIISLILVSLTFGLFCMKISEWHFLLIPSDSMLWSYKRMFQILGMLIILHLIIDLRSILFTFISLLTFAWLRF